MTEKRRVVVTGVGLLTPLGLDVKESWEAAKAGRSGIGPITQFDAAAFATRISGEVKGFDVGKYIEAKEIKKMDRFIHLALGAAQMAVDDSGLRIDDTNGERVGVVVGAGMGGIRSLEENHTRYMEKGPRRITPFFIPMVIINLASGQISMRFGAKGPNSAPVTACATGNNSIGDAARLIQMGYADAMIAGGAESATTPLGIGGFNAMRALSTRNDEPELASRPFDLDRDGFVMSEGSGIVILEELGAATKRGADIYAEFAGYGMTADAYHMTTPAPGGEGAVRCMRAALDDAALMPTVIDYINAHGTSTTFGDELETQAIKTVFGPHARKLAVSSTKSMTGHLLGGAGGVESVFSILSIRDGVAPPTINLDTPDPECDLDYVPGEARQMNIDCVLTNSFGFGGTNACLIFKRFNG